MMDVVFEMAFRVRSIAGSKGPSSGLSKVVVIACNNVHKKMKISNQLSLELTIFWKTILILFLAVKML
jgi:hypothetical protein